MAQMDMGQVIALATLAIDAGQVTNKASYVAQL